MSCLTRRVHSPWRDAEHLKHQEDLQEQLRILANEHAGALNDPSQAELPEAIARMPSSCARKSISLCQGSSCVAAIWFEVFDSLSQGTHCEVAFIVLDESISLCLGSSWVAAIWFEVFDSLCQRSLGEDAIIVFKEAISPWPGSSRLVASWFEVFDSLW